MQADSDCVPRARSGALIVGDTLTGGWIPCPTACERLRAGREGIRSAIEEMTEPRMLVMSGLS